MADDSSTSPPPPPAVATDTDAEPSVTFKVRGSNDKSHTITMPLSATVAELKARLSGAEFEDIPSDRQRLIYSGHVMKNHEPLSTYNIKNNMTVHLVKSAASNRNASSAAAASATGAAGASNLGLSSSSPSTQGVPLNMAAGTANSPLAALTGARFAGMAHLPGMEMFGPDAGLGAPPSQQDMIRMMQQPEYREMMGRLLDNPDMLDMAIQSHPVLRNMPGARELLQSPLVRNLLTNPEAMALVGNMRSAFGPAMGGAEAFPAPGATDSTPSDAPATAASAPDGANNNAASAGHPGATAAAVNPWDALAQLMNPGAQGAGGAMPPPSRANPFLALFNPPAAGAGAAPATVPGAAPAAAAPGTAPGTANDPLAQAMQMLSGAGAGVPPHNWNLPAFPPANATPGNANPEANAAGHPAGTPQLPPGLLNALLAGNPAPTNNILASLYGGLPPQQAPPEDTRPPELRYEEQLRQLNEMGFYNFEQNVAALRRSGGSVEGAVEHLLGGS